MVDIIYGFRIIFLIFLVLGSIWDEVVVEKMVEILVKEVVVLGLYVIFLLMVDLVCDLCWGCVMELIGEDLLFNSCLVVVMVRGY